MKNEWTIKGMIWLLPYTTIFVSMGEIENLGWELKLPKLKLATYVRIELLLTKANS